MSFLKPAILSTCLLAAMFNNAFSQSTWTSRISGITNALNSVILANNQLLAVGAGSTIVTSPNGVSWTTRHSGTTRTLYTVTWAGNRFIAGGNDSVRTSIDAFTWTAHYGTPQLISSLWNGKLMVAVGPGGLVVTSTDGVTWTSRAAFPSTPTFLAWSGTLIVAVGQGGAEMTSPDGISWTTISTGSIDVSGIKAIRSIVWTGSQFVAVGDSGTIWTSNGLTWAAKKLGTANTLFSIAWTGSQLVAVGAGGAIWVSPNGITWTVKNSGTTTTLRSVIWTGSQLVAVGDGGKILTSVPDAIPVMPRLQTQNNLSLHLTSSRLFATLPNAFLNSNSNAAIYNINGNKMVEVHSNGFAKEVALPLNNLSRGIYLLELQGQGTRIEQSFSLAR